MRDSYDIANHTFHELGYDKKVMLIVHLSRITLDKINDLGLPTMPGFDLLEDVLSMLDRKEYDEIGNIVVSLKLASNDYWRKEGTLSSKCEDMLIYALECLFHYRKDAKFFFWQTSLGQFPKIFNILNDRNISSSSLVSEYDYSEIIFSEEGEQMFINIVQDFLVL